MKSQVLFTVLFIAQAVATTLAAEKPIYSTEEITAEKGRLPVARVRIPPNYPRELRQTRQRGAVEVEFVIDIDGRTKEVRVLHSTDPAFELPAIQAIGKWVFEPAQIGRKAVKTRARQQVTFEPDDEPEEVSGVPGPVPAPDAPREIPTPMDVQSAFSQPALRERIQPAYPVELEERKLPGDVKIEFTVDETGRVVQPKVLHASHPAFVETALRALAQASFEPARRGSLPQASKMVLPIVFDRAESQPAEILRANHMEVRGRAPSSLPQVLMLVPPVFPRERLLDATKARAIVDFSINEKGLPARVEVKEATAPEYGAALKAAVEAWVFTPGRSNHLPESAKMRVVHEFSAGADAAEARLIGLMPPGGPGIGGPAGLDRKLKPLWRGFPVYPQDLREERLAGEAEIEFIVDREGRSRLPRIVKASNEAFGWAAVTAISQWVFEKPTRGGQPVDVTVRVPVGFKPPRAK